jgi:hypothetical protein
MTTLESLQKEIDEIKGRNRRVETDKAWETSWTRRLLVIALTYAVVVVFFLVAALPQPFINAIVPSLAFVLSTLTVPVFKNWWIKRRGATVKPPHLRGQVGDAAGRRVI